MLPDHAEARLPAREAGGSDIPVAPRGSGRVLLTVLDPELCNSCLDGASLKDGYAGHCASCEFASAMDGKVIPERLVRDLEICI